MKKIGSMKIRFENLAGVFTHIEGPNLEEIKEYAKRNNLTYVDGIKTQHKGKDYFCIDYQKPE